LIECVPVFVVAVLPAEKPFAVISEFDHTPVNPLPDKVPPITGAARFVTLNSTPVLSDVVANHAPALPLPLTSKYR
jgi:hypothetical protein